MNVMLLAAGEGTRLRPHTSILPKPAIPFLTVPLAAYSLGFLHDQKINKLVVNTYHLPDKIHKLFEELPKAYNEIHFSDETTELLGSGGGLSRARQHFLGGGDFLMMNADEIILPKDRAVLERALDHHKSTNALATLLVMDHPGVGTQFGGVWCDSKNGILGFGKMPAAKSQRAWHFIGVQIFSERIFAYIPESGPSNILYDAASSAISKKEVVQAYPIECQWFETGNPRDFLEASATCFKNIWLNDLTAKQSLLPTIETFSQKVSIENTGSCQLVRSANVQLDSSSRLQGLIVLGKDVVVEKDCDLKNCIVANNVTVKAGTVAHDTIIL